VKPVDDKHWRVALAMRFPVSVSSEGDNVVEFGAKLDHEELRSVYTVSNSVTVPSGDDGELPVMTVEAVDLEPGRYDLSIRIDDPRVGKPRTAIGHVDVPALPRRGLLVVEPILLRPVSDDLIMHWSDGGSPSPKTTATDGFEPIFANGAVESDSLTAVTQVCRILPKAKGTPATLDVRRRLLSSDGVSVSTLTPSTLELPVAKGVSCRKLVDTLPGGIDPGEYRFEVTAQTDGKASPVVGTAGVSIRGRP
jgi:hypothetical protein